MHTVIWVGIGVVLFVAGVLGVVVLVGMALPVGHSATSRAEIPAPQTAVWETLNAFEEMPSWRPGVRRVEQRVDDQGREIWIEHGRTGPRPMVVEWKEPPRLLVGRITGDKMAFGGSWTFELNPTDGATAVTITENGEVYNPVFRFVSRFVVGYHGTMDHYLKCLGRKYGADVSVEHVSDRDR